MPRWPTASWRWARRTGRSRSPPTARPTDAVQALVTAAIWRPLRRPADGVLLGIRQAPSVAGAAGAQPARARAFALEYLAGASSVEWLARLTHLVDVAIFPRSSRSTARRSRQACWCFGIGGSRGVADQAGAGLAVIVDDGAAGAALAAYHRVRRRPRRVRLPSAHLPFEPPFYGAGVGEWKTDIEAGCGIRSGSRCIAPDRCSTCGRWSGRVAVAGVERRSPTPSIATSCTCSPTTAWPTCRRSRSSRTPSSTASASSRRRSGSTPRAAAAGRRGARVRHRGRASVGRSTLERFATARGLMPEHEAIFREAADTLADRALAAGAGRHQPGHGRRRTAAGAPEPLDRQVLKGGFRSILRLLEFTADRQWLDHL